MIVFFKNRWVLLVVLVVFTICKLPHLYYGFYWDEGTPYAIAIKDMYKHGISLMPDAINTEVSRGHPLFFHAFAATWMNIFGVSNTSLHAFALFISVILLIAVYETGLRLFNQRTAIISVILVAIQVIFFVQSSFVLPEVLIALLAFLSLYFYVKDHYVLTVVFLTALFYSKETGLIAGVVLGIDAIIGLFNNKTQLKIRVSRLASVLIPCLLISLFFIAQKRINGWYFYPEHTGLIKYQWELFFYCFKTQCMYSAFIMDFRYYYFLLALALSLMAAIKSKNYKYLVIFIQGIFTFYFVDDMRSGRIMPGIPFFILFICSIIFMLYSLIRLKILDTPLRARSITLYCSFIFCFFCFSAMNFFTPRYSLIAIVPLLFFAAVIIDKMIALTYKVLFYPVLFLILIIGFFSFKTNDGNGDADPGAFDGVEAQQKVVDYLEKNNCYDKVIWCGDFLERQNLLFPATGYLQSDKIFKNIKWYINDTTEYAIFDYIDTGDMYSKIKQEAAFHLAYRFQKGKAWAEVYEKKP